MADSGKAQPPWPNVSNPSAARAHLDSDYIKSPGGSSRRARNRTQDLPDPFMFEVIVDAYERFKTTSDKSMQEILEYIPPECAIRSGVGSGGIRYLFGEDTPPALDPFEAEAIDKMRAHLKKQRFPVDGTFFNQDSYLLRFLQGNGWDVHSTFQDMKRHLEWRSANLPIHISVVSPYLNTGIFYIHGRDRQRRPVLILRGSELGVVDKDDALRVVIYWLEFAVAKLMIPNRVEQWEVIIDLANVGVTTAPVMALKEVASTLYQNYRGRLAKLIFINCPLVFMGVWQAVSHVLPEVTRRKISSYSTNSFDQLCLTIHPNQLESRFGGSQSDVIDFSMPTLPAGPYDDDGSSIATPAQDNEVASWGFPYTWFQAAPQQPNLNNETTRTPPP